MAERHRAKRRLNAKTSVPAQRERQNHEPIRAADRRQQPSSRSALPVFGGGAWSLTLNPPPRPETIYQLSDLFLEAVSRRLTSSLLLSLILKRENSAPTDHSVNCAVSEIA